MLKIRFCTRGEFGLEDLLATTEQTPCVEGKLGPPLDAQHLRGLGSSSNDSMRGRALRNRRLTLFRVTPKIHTNSEDCPWKDSPARPGAS